MNRGLSFKGATSEENAQARDEESAVKQREWFLEIADDIEQGRLPDHSLGRALIASALRHVADGIKAPTKPKRRGNPNFKPVYDPDQVALMMGLRVRAGRSMFDAGFEVGEQFGIDGSTAQKVYRDRRAAIDRLLRLARPRGRRY